MIAALLFLLVSLLDFLKPPIEKYRAKNPEVVCWMTEAEARNAAREDATKHSGIVYDNSGTTSMEPLIVGKVFIVGVPKPYDLVQEGEVLTYKPKWANGQNVTHRAVKKDKDGWIASGDNDAHYENWERVRPDNYASTVIRVHTYKGAEKTRVKK